jgi:hypothetical protein
MCISCDSGEPVCHKCNSDMEIIAPAYDRDEGPICPVCEPEEYDRYRNWLEDDAQP